MLSRIWVIARLPGKARTQLTRQRLGLSFWQADWRSGVINASPVWAVAPCIVVLLVLHGVQGQQLPDRLPGGLSCCIRKPMQPSWLQAQPRLA